MTPDEQWRRIRFPKGEFESGAMGRFFIDSLMPAIEDLGQHVDLSTVAIFEVDDSRGGKYLYFSPGAFAALFTLASEHGAQPCDRPAPEGLSLAYGDEWAARKLLAG